MSKQTLWIDMDEVICNFLNKLLCQCKEKLNIDIKLPDIKQWELKQYIGEEGIKLFNTPGFFIDLKPIDGSIKYLKKLHNEEHKTFIISSPQNEYCAFEKYQWVKKHLSFFPIGNLILVGNKGDLLSKIYDGILFDDCGKYLEMFRGTSVAMDMPYNQNVQSEYRVSSWEDFYYVVKSLEISNRTNRIQNIHI